jgi:hypothetical protein
MANKIIGRFYLKQTSNGNLIGEWSNNTRAEIFTESCDLREKESSALRKSANDRFLGVYYSTWQEGGQPCFANLTISPKTGNDKLFTLKWRGIANFDGEGMLCDDILIGDYHQV